MSVRIFSFAAIAALTLAVPALAHHSHAMYVQGEDVLIDVQGTVSEVHWINPHVWVYLDVADQQGQSTIWALEGGSVGELTRGGWTEDSIEIGDDIIVRCRATKDGTAGCLLGYVTSINGTEMYKEFD